MTRLVTWVVAAGLAAAAAEVPPQPSRGAVRGARRRTRTPRAAFQVGETIFELPTSEYGSKPYLIQFKGKGDDYCSLMEPMKEQLREVRSPRLPLFFPCASSGRLSSGPLTRRPHAARRPAWKSGPSRYGTTRRTWS